MTDGVPVSVHIYCTGSALGSLLRLKNEADVGQMALHSGSNLMVFF